MVQWLRVSLPMQESWVRTLVREDSTHPRATKPVHHNYWTSALEPGSHSYWRLHAPELVLQTREATTVRSPSTSNKRIPSTFRNNRKSQRSNKIQHSQKWNNNLKQNTNKILYNHHSCTSRERSSATQKLACVQFQSWPPYSLQMNRCPYFHRKDKK